MPAARTGDCGSARDVVQGAWKSTLVDDDEDDTTKAYGRRVGGCSAFFGSARGRLSVAYDTKVHRRKEHPITCLEASVALAGARRLADRLQAYTSMGVGRGERAATVGLHVFVAVVLRNRDDAVCRACPQGQKRIMCFAWGCPSCLSGGAHVVFQQVPHNPCQIVFDGSIKIARNVELDVDAVCAVFMRKLQIISCHCINCEVFAEPGRCCLSRNGSANLGKIGIEFVAVAPVIVLADSCT